MKRAQLKSPLGSPAMQQSVRAKQKKGAAADRKAAAKAWEANNRRGAIPLPPVGPGIEVNPDERMILEEKWDREMDELLREGVLRYGAKWGEVSTHMSPHECPKEEVEKRWEMVKGNPVKGPWSPEEDSLLKVLVDEYGSKKWSLIATQFPGRSGKQCRERWLNHLDIRVRKSAWTGGEDVVLCEAQERLGNKWSEISKLLPGRAENAVKNRFNSIITKRLAAQGISVKGSSGLEKASIAKSLASAKGSNSSIDINVLNSATKSNMCLSKKEQRRKELMKHLACARNAHIFEIMASRLNAQARESYCNERCQKGDMITGSGYTLDASDSKIVAFLFPLADQSRGVKKTGAGHSHPARAPREAYRQGLTTLKCPADPKQYHLRNAETTPSLTRRRVANREPRSGLTHRTTTSRKATAFPLSSAFVGPTAGPSANPDASSSREATGAAVPAHNSRGAGGERDKELVQSICGLLGGKNSQGGHQGSIPRHQLYDKGGDGAGASAGAGGDFPAPTDPAPNTNGRPREEFFGLDSAAFSRRATGGGGLAASGEGAVMEHASASATASRKPLWRSNVRAPRVFQRRGSTSRVKFRRSSGGSSLSRPPIHACELETFRQYQNMLLSEEDMDMKSIQQKRQDAFSQIYSASPKSSGEQEPGLIMPRGGAAVPTRKAAMEIEAGGGVDVREGQASAITEIWSKVQIKGTDLPQPAPPLQTGVPQQHRH
ncbi:unnamed protein product [Scytosiphon promiscuus]